MASWEFGARACPGRRRQRTIFEVASREAPTISFYGTCLGRARGPFCKELTRQPARSEIVKDFVGSRDGAVLTEPRAEHDQAYSRNNE